jgi:hypothetical protein
MKSLHLKAYKLSIIQNHTHLTSVIGADQITEHSVGKGAELRNTDRKEFCGGVTYYDTILTAVWTDTLTSR